MASPPDTDRVCLFVLKWCVIITLGLVYVPASAQEVTLGGGVFRSSEKGTTFTVDSDKSQYALPDSFLIPESEQVWLDSLILKRNIDYELNYVTGALSFVRLLPDSAAIQVAYRVLPFSLRKTYFHRLPVHARAHTENARGVENGEIRPLPQPARPATGYLPSTLRRSGSIVRGISIGSNQNLQVESGLRLQLSGRLAQNVDVVASLTDEDTPIQPEGNTQTINEIDKVFIQVKGPNLQATLGDYYLELAGGEFTNYSRKLEGVMGEGNFDNNDFKISAASSRGQFATNEFPGKEGNQGPYQLSAPSGNIRILVLAGTERVWIDGEQVKRGENNDYVIEYGNGQITFTRNRLITADSRIVVDFQFSDESFRRNYLAAQGKMRLWNDKIRLGTTFIRESDDKDDPLGFSITDDAIAALEVAGDDLAIVPGGTLVGEGEGTYVKDSTGVFNFVGLGNGNYNVSFSFFGTGKGDYRNTGLGRFEYVGPNDGDYLPFVILPQAQRHDLVGVNFDFAPVQNVTLRSELAFSQFDRNLYSSKDDGDNSGTAYNVTLRFSPEQIKVGGRNFGKLDFSGYLRRKNRNFREIDRSTIAEFNRRWNIPDSVSTRKEDILELRGDYQPLRGFSVGGGVGRLSKSSLFEANRWDLRTQLSRANLPNLDYFLEFIDRNDDNIGQKSEWLRQRGRAEYDLRKLRPVLEYEGEIKKDTNFDSSRTGFRYNSFTAALHLSPWKVLTAVARYNVRDDDDRVAGAFVDKSIAKTQTYSLTLKNWHALNLLASYTHRERNFSDQTVSDTRTDLADIRIGFRPRQSAISSNLNYQISNTQVARQEEVFIEVDEGTGNFRFNEDFNEFEPAAFGNFVRRLFSTGEFIPVVELKMRLDLRLRPGKFFGAEQSQSGFFERMFRPVTTESFLRIDERTTEDDVGKIYFLNLNAFQQDSTTIFGSIEFRQDVYLWRNNRELSVRYRYRNRNELNNQFVEGGQDREVLEQRLRVLYRFTHRFSLQTEYIHSSENLEFGSATRADRQIRSDELQMDLVFRPVPKWELGLKGEYSRNKDLVPSPDTKADLFAFTPRANYSLSKKGRLRAEFQWARVSVSPKNRLIPFELTDGRRAGSTFRWNVSLEYRVSQNVRASATYFGRSEPDLPNTQHIARVEMRAFF